MEELIKLLVLGAVGMILILGGCSMFKNKKETLTREQQDQIVQYIANNYEGVKKVEFDEISENKLAGILFVNLKINDTNYLSLSLGNDVSDVSHYSPGWDPKTFKLKEKDTKDDKTNIDTIEIVYLGEQYDNRKEL